MSGAKLPEPRQWREAERWLARAEEDLRAAEALLDLATPIIGPAAFHCQQAAEKMAKAVLIAAREPPPRLHDIDELGHRIAPLHPEIAEAIDALGGITGWYAAARYPDAGSDIGPSVADVREVLSDLRRLRRQIDTLKPK